MGIRRHLGGSVYFLLDISPSMQGDGLAQAKRGLQDLVGQVISDGFGIGLITFDSKTRFLCSPTRDPASLRERVNDLRITGQGTVMAPAIGMAAAKLSGETGAKFIILATDERPTIPRPHTGPPAGPRPTAWRSSPSEPKVRTGSSWNG